MNEQDGKQNIELALLKQRLDSFEKTFKNKVDGLVYKIEKWDGRLDDMIRSFNEDKKNCKLYMDETFVTKNKANPVIKLFEQGRDKLTMVGAAVVLFLIFAGAVSLGAANFIKNKIINILH